jgi:hypothetical protein
MRTAMLASLLLAVGASKEAPMDGGLHPYQQPAKARDFSAEAVVIPPQAIGKTMIRAKQSLGVEIKVRVEDYLPRGLEPTLLLGGVPVEGRSWVSATEGNVTTLSFLVEKPELLKEGAEVALQTGDEATRVRVPGKLQLRQIKSLQPEEEKRRGLPPLQEWLKQGS